MYAKLLRDWRWQVSTTVRIVSTKQLQLAARGAERRFRQITAGRRAALAGVVGRLGPSTIRNVHNQSRCLYSGSHIPDQFRVAAEHSAHNGRLSISRRIGPIRRSIPVRVIVPSRHRDQCRNNLRVGRIKSRPKRFTWWSINARKSRFRCAGTIAACRFSSTSSPGRSSRRPGTSP